MACIQSNAVAAVLALSGAVLMFSICWQEFHGSLPWEKPWMCSDAELLSEEERERERLPYD